MRKGLLAVAILLAALSASGCAPAAPPAAPPLQVYYAGPEGGVREALDLAVREAGLQWAAGPAQADVLVLNGTIPDAAALAEQVRSGAGLVLCLGPDLDAAQASTLLGRPVRLEPQSTPLSLTDAPGAHDALLRQIVWNSAPQVRERISLPESGLTPLVAGFEDGALVLGQGALGKGQVFVVTALLDDANPQLQAWGYFNYLFYHLAARAAGRSPLSFAGYAGSPVPHAAEQRLLYVVLAAMLASAGVIFWAVRRHSKAHPEALDRLLADRRANPAFGSSTGGLLGLGLAAYATQLFSFLLGFVLYRRLGYDACLLFMAHFDWRTVVSAFRFGVFEMLGGIAWAIGEALVILITQLRLINYNEIWGNWTLASNFIAAYTILQVLYANLMPGISEAISHGYKRLSQYYAAMGYKWGGMISAFVGAVLLAVADRFILGASGPEFVRAAAYAVPLILWGVVQFGSWAADEVQNGSNRPYLRAAMTGLEQVIRIALALALVARWQIHGLIAAYFVGILTKVLVSYALNHRLCFPLRYFAWQSLAAPILAGAVHYCLLRWVTGLIWQGDQVTSIVILFVGLLPSLPLYALLYGLAGGWDDDALAEVQQAVSLTSFMRPLAWLFWAASDLGARLSPLHGRFPITIRAAALEEARQLTVQRVRLA